MDDRGVSGCVFFGVFFDASLMLPWSALDACPALRAEAGFRPGGRPTFLPRGKKVGKETRPNARDPCASLRGDLRRGGCGVRCGTRCVHCVNSAQTTAASQMTKQSCPSAGLQPRNHHAAGADIRGSFFGPSLCLAWGFGLVFLSKPLSFRAAPCTGAGASKHLFSKRGGLPVNEALSRLDHWTVGACPRPYGYGRDGATRKGVRTSLSVF